MYLPEIFLRNRVNHKSSQNVFIISFTLTFLLSRSWFINPDFNIIINSSLLLFTLYISGGIIYHSEIIHFIENSILNADKPIMDAFNDYNSVIKLIKLKLIKKLLSVLIILLVFNFF